jgi:hypothetical protein
MTSHMRGVTGSQSSPRVDSGGNEYEPYDAGSVQTGQPSTSRAKALGKRWPRSSQSIVWLREPERSRYLNVVIAGEATTLTAETVRRLWGSFERRTASMTIVCVVPRHGIVESLAPLSGLFTFEEIRVHYRKEAVHAATNCVGEMPGTVPARHLVAATWAEAIRMTLDSGCDALVITGPPGCWRDRAALVPLRHQHKKLAGGFRAELSALPEPAG